jgi:hypothetical protein
MQKRFKQQLIQMAVTGKGSSVKDFTDLPMLMGSTKPQKPNEPDKAQTLKTHMTPESNEKQKD